MTCIRPRPLLLAVSAFAALAALAILLPPSIRAQTVIASDWLGDGSTNFSNGNWSNAALWNPGGVPNNGGGNVYDVTIAQDPNGAQFNGPQLDINVTIQNLTLVNRAFVDNQFNIGTSLTVTGTTAITTTPGHDGETAAIFATGVFTLGTLSSYNAATHTLETGFFFPLGGGTIQFRGADIITNNATVIVGDNSHFLNQDTGVDAYVNLAVNNGGFNLGGGHDFTTVGNFTNNGGLTVGNSTDGLSSRFTVSGSLTNFDAATHTLSNGGFDVGNNATGGTVTLRFANADIRTISFANVRVAGEGASLTDLSGNDGLRNLGRVENGAFTSGVTQAYAPGGVVGGVFAVSNSTHTLLPGAASTVMGDYNASGNSVVSINAPSPAANTTLFITGSALFDSGVRLDLGGPPDANAPYQSVLRVSGGVEFRGATVTGSGLIFTDALFTQGATLAPGEPARVSPVAPSTTGQMTFVGALTLQSGTTLDLKIGGLTPGAEFDQILQSGSMLTTLGGTLRLSFLNGFESGVTTIDTFEIVRSDNPILGAFDNAANGDRLLTADGLGSFVVNYNGSDIFLSDFQPVPEPSTWLGGGATAALLARAIIRRRARRAQTI